MKHRARTGLREQTQTQTQDGIPIFCVQQRERKGKNRGGVCVSDSEGVYRLDRDEGIQTSERKEKRERESEGLVGIDPLAVGVISNRHLGQHTKGELSPQKKPNDQGERGRKCELSASKRREGVRGERGKERRGVIRDSEKNKKKMKKGNKKKLRREMGGTGRGGDYLGYPSNIDRVMEPHLHKREKPKAKSKGQGQRTVPSPFGVL